MLVLILNLRNVTFHILLMNVIKSMLNIECLELNYIKCIMPIEIIIKPLLEGNILNRLTNIFYFFI